MRRRFASILTLGTLAAIATVALAATPAAAHYRHFHGYRHGYFPYAYPSYYDYGPVYYPPVVVAPPPVVVAPPPVYAAPVVAGPALPAPVPSAYPPAAAGYPAVGAPGVPVAPGIEGTPDCLVVREYTTEIEVGGAPAEGYGYACLQADGSWKRGAPEPVR